jgi:hypothetical protein
MKLSAYAKHLGIGYQTAWRIWQRRELPAHQLPSGTVIVEAPISPVIDLCVAKGWPVAKVVKECGRKPGESFG